MVPSKLKAPKLKGTERSENREKNLHRNSNAQKKGSETRAENLNTLQEGGRLNTNNPKLTKADPSNAFETGEKREERRKKKKK